MATAAGGIGEAGRRRRLVFTVSKALVGFLMQSQGPDSFFGLRVKVSTCALNLTLNPATESDSQARPLLGPCSIFGFRPSQRGSYWGSPAGVTGTLCGVQGPGLSRGARRSPQRQREALGTRRCERHSTTGPVASRSAPSGLAALRAPASWQRDAHISELRRATLRHGAPQPAHTVRSRGAPHGQAAEPRRAPQPAGNVTRVCT